MFFILILLHCPTVLLKSPVVFQLFKGIHLRLDCVERTTTTTSLLTKFITSLKNIVFYER